MERETSSGANPTRSPSPPSFDSSIFADADEGYGVVQANIRDEVDTEKLNNEKPRAGCFFGYQFYMNYYPDSLFGERVLNQVDAGDPIFADAEDSPDYESYYLDSLFGERVLIQVDADDPIFADAEDSPDYEVWASFLRLMNFPFDDSSSATVPTGLSPDDEELPEFSTTPPPTLIAHRPYSDPPPLLMLGDVTIPSVRPVSWPGADPIRLHEISHLRQRNVAHDDAPFHVDEVATPQLYGHYLEFSTSYLGSSPSYPLYELLEFPTTPPPTLISHRPHSDPPPLLMLGDVMIPSAKPVS